ncbi:MFS transporter, SP family, sugar:H+ symporter [Babesia microti strain RI]|uniref:Hexose transporter 1 n=1 Tax=Babesia microti (strain RI) TaxID=1133968 RepID=A0A0K3ATH6_BABMR|nr:MFS transporter, SP family, sugar:H+ symporter [Babesia microti strain RI]CTQ40866.1 MFS transporter, SP family, sugar:H+ symporter [Babesia microti strain RI]|eukprot:XP_012648877.1 MFS transporter, SP family, sugar:H+ symporter [Babesia microti strain RI]
MSIVAACCGAMNFGIHTVSFNASRDFAAVDLKWCDDDNAKRATCDTAVKYGGMLSSFVFLGATLGAGLTSVIVKFGRRKALLFIHLLNIVGTILCVAAQEFVTLLIGRLIAGLGVGMSVVVPLYISEISPTKSRGFYSSFYQFFIVFGQLVTNSLQLLYFRVVEDDKTKEFVLSTTDMFLWRFIIGLPILFSLISITIFMTVSRFETPRQLMVEGKSDEAKKVLTILHGEEELQSEFESVLNDVESSKVSDASPNMVEDGDGVVASKQLGLIKCMSSPKYFKVIVITLVISSLSQLSGINVLMANATRLFFSILGRVYLATTVSSMFTMVNLITTIVAVFIIDKVGRRKLLIVGTVIMSLFMIPASISLIAYPEHQTTQILCIIGAVGFCIGFSIGFGSVLWVYFVEVYPPEIKDYSVSAATLINWISGFAIVLASDAMLSYSKALVYSIFTVVCVVSTVVCVLFVKETSGMAIGKAY